MYREVHLFYFYITFIFTCTFTFGGIQISTVFQRAVSEALYVCLDPVRLLLGIYPKHVPKDEVKGVGEYSVPPVNACSVRSEPQGGWHLLVLQTHNGWSASRVVAAVRPVLCVVQAVCEQGCPLVWTQLKERNLVSSSADYLEKWLGIPIHTESGLLFFLIIKFFITHSNKLLPFSD